jgi:hypothetical protein
MIRQSLILALALAGQAPAVADPGTAKPAAASKAAPFRAANVLEELLIEAADNPDKRPDFIAALLDADVYLATPDVPEQDGVRDLKAGEKLDILSAKLGDGRILPALFTSKDRIRDYFGPDTGFIALPGRAALEMVGGKGVVINPGAAFGVVLSDTNVAAVLGQPVARTLGKQTTLRLGTPAVRPVKLIARIEAIFADEPRVKELWLSWAQWTESGEYVWYLQVGTEAPAEEITPLLGKLNGAPELIDYPLDALIVRPSELNRNGIRIKP